MVLIMDLTLLTLEDIAWPDSRITQILEQLPCFSEMLMSALGLVLLPASKGAKLET